MLTPERFAQGRMMLRAGLVVGICLIAGACASPPEPTTSDGVGPDGDVAPSALGCSDASDAAPEAVAETSVSASEARSALDAAATDLEEGVPASDTVPAADAPERKSGWTFIAKPMGWIPSIKGSVTIGNVKVRPDLSAKDFFDAWKDTNSRTIELHGAARHESGWGFFGEVIDLKLEADDTAVATVGSADLFPAVPGSTSGRKVKADVDATLRWTMIELGVGKDVTNEWMAERGIQVDAIGGVRYWEVDIDLDLNGTNLTGDDADWADPFVGFRTHTQLSDDGVWSLVVRADVGGGSIGEASKIATRYVGLLEYKPWETVSILMGWNHLDNDWSQGSGSSKAAWNLRLSGPVMAMAIEF